jgi:hypothetical protein
MGKAPSGSFPESVYASRRYGVSCCALHNSKCLRTGMADTRVVDLNADLALLWWLDFDILNAQVLAGLPGNGSLRTVSRRPTQYMALLVYACSPE